MPTQNETATTTAFRWSMPSLATVSTPSMKTSPIIIIMYAAATGAGIANNTAVSFGSSARNMNMMPAHIPTARDATPVRLIIATLGEAVIVGIVPDSPDTRLLNPLMLRPPWMSLKSLARDWRRETRWTALMSATALKDVIIVMSKKAGRRAQNFRPGDRSKPGQAFWGIPTQGAACTRLVS